MRYLLILALLIIETGCSQGFKIKKKINLPKKIKETSGLIYLNKRLITFNDSGGKAELYSVNPSSGEIDRKIKIKNATNIDWEGITQDEIYIYIADTGNNFGDRKDLVIYKVKKDDVLKLAVVKAEKIHFSYKDQISFIKKNHKSNFDCESITSYKGELLLFTKNWKDYQTNVYRIPSKKGTYTAVKSKSLNINCLLTSIDYHKDTETFIGTAYDKKYKSYLIKIQQYSTSSPTVKRIELTKKFSYANQIEGVAWKDNNEIYITREACERKLNGKKYNHKQKLFLLKLID